MTIHFFTKDEFRGDFDVSDWEFLEGPKIDGKVLAAPPVR